MIKIDVGGFTGYLHSHVKQQLLKASEEALSLSIAAGLSCPGTERTVHMEIENCKDKDPAMALLGKVYKILHVKPECSSIFDRGFIWFDNFCTQRVWASDPVELEDSLNTKVHIETDFLKIPMKAPDVIDSLAHMMRGASLSGPVVYPLALSIKLRSSVSIDLENQHWTLPLLWLTAWLQYREVAAFGDEITRMHKPEEVRRDYDLTVCNECVPNTLDHFSSLPISSRDNLLTNLPTPFFLEMGAKLQRMDFVFCADGRTLSAYLPFGRGKALLVVSANEKHPIYDEGLLILLALPPGVIPDSSLNGDLICNMNLRDAGSRELRYFLGSWCLGPGAGRRGFAPAFVTFIPAAWCNPILAKNLILSMLDRCAWAEKLIRDGIGKLGFNTDYPIAHEIAPHKPIKWPPEENRVTYEFLAPKEGDKLLDEIYGCVTHIVEDVCSSSCPIGALRTYDRGTDRNTCDPRDYARNCGVAELRELYLLRGKEVR